MLLTARTDLPLSLFLCSSYELHIFCHNADNLMFFMHLLIFISLLLPPCTLHFPSHILSSISCPLIPAFSLSLLSLLDPSLWISGRVWLWFGNQSQASWFHVVSHLCSQCLVRYIHILLQGKKSSVCMKMLGTNRQHQTLCLLLPSVKYFSLILLYTT